jgi:transposase-like protein
MSIRHWFYAAHHFAQSKNSVSSSEMASYLGINQKSAFLLLNTLRILVAYTNKQERFTGIIEIDVTYIGGKKKAPRNAEKKIGHNGQENKTIVFGMRERRTGKVRTFIVSRESKEETLPIIQANVEIGSIIHSDEAAAYKCLPMYGYSHEFVNHKKFEWKRGNVTIQPIEGFWSDIKRSIRGTHIWVSKDYMREYLNEYEFRHNNCDKSVRECWIILIGLLLNAPPSAVQEVLFSRYKP